MSLLELSTDDFEDLLHELASVALCKRRHARGKEHDQHERTVERWERAIAKAAEVERRDEDTIMGQPGDTRRDLLRKIDELNARLERQKITA